MSLSVNGSNSNNPFAYLQLWQQQATVSASGAQAQSDPLSALLASLGQSTRPQRRRSATASSTSGGVAVGRDLAAIRSADVAGLARAAGQQRDRATVVVATRQRGDRDRPDVGTAEPAGPARPSHHHHHMDANGTDGQTDRRSLQLPQIRLVESGNGRQQYPQSIAADAGAVNAAGRRAKHYHGLALIGITRCCFSCDRRPDPSPFRATARWT